VPKVAEADFNIKHACRLKAEFLPTFASFGAEGILIPIEYPNRHNAACGGVCGVERRRKGLSGYREQVSRCDYKQFRRCCWKQFTDQFSVQNGVFVYLQQPDIAC